MGWGNVDIDRMTELHGGSGREYNVPEMPDFIARPATFGFVGKQPAEDELAVIQALHDLYNSNLAELKTAHEGRELARAQREAYLKAHPPQPKNITLNYWRTEKPATTRKGAAR